MDVFIRVLTVTARMSTQQTKIVIKISLCGESGVGKTSLRRRWMGKGFAASHLPTLGADFAVKTLEYPDKVVEAQIWDLAGQASFEILRKRFFIGAGGALLVFDLTDENSLLRIPKWIQELHEANPGRRIPMVLVGNKNDLVEHRVIDQEYLDHFMNDVSSRPELLDNPLYYIETSALTGEHVEDAFRYIINKAIEYSKKSI